MWHYFGNLQKNYFIKICGITKIEDLNLAVQYGVDAVGFVLSPVSTRCTSVEFVIEVQEKFPDILKFLVFGYDDTMYIKKMVSRLLQDKILIQLPSEHKGFSNLVQYLSIHSIIPTISVKRELSTESLQNLSEFPVVLFDSPPLQNNIPGGTGHTFSWDLIRSIDRSYILAGGLNFQNIQSAIKSTQAIGFDVASGVESQPGIKDSQKMNDFITQIRNFFHN